MALRALLADTRTGRHLDGRGQRPKRARHAQAAGSRAPRGRGHDRVLRELRSAARRLQLPDGGRTPCANANDNRPRPTRAIARASCFEFRRYALRGSHGGQMRAASEILVQLLQG